MKYHTLFFSKIGKDVANLSSAAVVIGTLRVNSLHAGKFFTLFCHLLVFFKINLFQKFFQEYHQTVEQFGSRSGSSSVRPVMGPKLIAKVFSRRHLPAKS